MRITLDKEADEAGKTLGIEILDASKSLPQEV